MGLALGFATTKAQSPVELTTSGAFPTLFSIGPSSPVRIPRLSAAFLLLSALPSFADQVINDDLIVIGGACIGLDCFNNENFGGDTVKLKENNTRISFGTGEQVVMQANQSGSGSISEFAIGSGATTTDPKLAFGSAGDGVILGQGSTRVAGAVSVGSTGNERQIKRVADAEADNDLINVRQMNAALAAPPPAPLTNEMNEVEVVSAMTAALSALQPNPRASGPFSFSVGLGAYEGNTAAAAGISWRASASTLVKFGVAKSSDSDASASLSLNFAW